MGSWGIDTQNTFCRATSYAAAAGTAVVGDNFDTATIGTLSVGAPTGAVVAGAGQARNLGVGEELYGHILVTTACTQASTDGTVIIQFVSAATSTLTSSPRIHWQSETFTDGASASGGADLNTVGNLIEFFIPPDDKTWLRYVGFLFVIATQTVSAGAVTMWMDHAKAAKPFIYANGLSY